MKLLYRTLLAATLVTGVVLCPGSMAQSQPSPQSGGAEKLDEGELDPAWFDGRNPIEFRKTGVVDFLWVKEGLTLRGQRLHLDKWDPPALDPTDDDVDRTKAAELTELMPEDCLKEWEEVFKGDPACSITDGGIRVVGRIVDINVPTSFMSMAWPILTFDLKMIDKESGELLVAMHHRVAQKQRPAMRRWFGKVAEAMSQGLEKTYARGKKPQD